MIPWHTIVLRPERNMISIRTIEVFLGSRIPPFVLTRSVELPLSLKYWLHRSGHKHLLDWLPILHRLIYITEQVAVLRKIRCAERCCRYEHGCSSWRLCEERVSLPACKTRVLVLY
jgi:hypothetical protein